MMNGEGLRVVLWLSSCHHHCYKCQNPQTWDRNGGIEFDMSAKEELFRELDKEYISGLTLSGGDPLDENNIYEVLELVNEVKEKYPTKNIWIYSGYYWDEIFEPSFTNQSQEWINDYLMKCEIRKQIISKCDVFIDGRYVDSMRNVSAKWRGSTNQSVIDVQKSLKQGKVILYCD